jgi:hypothetical protein
MRCDHPGRDGQQATHSAGPVGPRHIGGAPQSARVPRGSIRPRPSTATRQDGTHGAAGCGGRATGCPSSRSPAGATPVFVLWGVCVTALPLRRRAVGHASPTGRSSRCRGAGGRRMCGPSQAPRGDVGCRGVPWSRSDRVPVGGRWGAWGRPYKGRFFAKVTCLPSFGIL